MPSNQYPPEVLAALSSAVPGLPTELATVWLDAYVGDAGRDAGRATTLMRQSDQYDVFYPGNRNPDGTVKYSENQYTAIRTDMTNTLRDEGIDPSFFEDRITDMIAGDVSPYEFRQRVDTVSRRIRTSSDEIRAFYAEQYGIEVDDASIIGTVLDPDLSGAVFEEGLTIAEIGGAAAEQGFAIGVNLAGELEDIGINVDEARDIFAQADLQLPTMQRLAARHRDPDDPFDLNEFLESAAFADADTIRGMQRLTRTETGRFSRGGPGTGFDQRGVGGLSTLVDR